MSLGSKQRKRVRAWMEKNPGMSWQTARQQMRAHAERLRAERAPAPPAEPKERFALMPGEAERVQAAIDGRENICPPPRRARIVEVNGVERVVEVLVDGKPLEGVTSIRFEER